ncbi:prepilin-type N-terminal cleavage/methylation domain-containing protein [Candidatus Gracilibacteria bacterium]|nr:prepilin-type N-terminal cleavage/methylation domain-containing protein [Candidatus Gracilibacteria bacterium]
MKLQQIKKRKIYAFTLVELIIVITILAILATIGFISFKNYIIESRDANRVTTLKNIQKGLVLSEIRLGKYLNPDDYVTINSGSIIYIKQGKIGSKISNTISLNREVTDPKDYTSYIYNVSGDNKKYQIGTFLEKNDDLYFSYISKTFALENINRYLYTLGDDLGIFVKKDSNTPLIKTESFTGVDLGSNSPIDNYTIYFSNTGSITSNSGSEIIDALNNSMNFGDINENNGNNQSSSPYLSNKLYNKGESFTFDNLTWYVSNNKNVAYTKALTGELTKNDNILVFQNGTGQLIKGDSAFILQTVNVGATIPFIYGTTYSNGKKWNELNVYSNDKDSRKQLYLDDKVILGDIFQWGRNDPVTILNSTGTLYTGTGFATGGINLSSTPWGDWFILNPNGAGGYVYSWLKKQISSTDPFWNEGPCDNGYIIPTGGANGDWIKIMNLAKDSPYNTGLELMKLQEYLLIPMAGYRQYDTDTIGYFGQGYYANLWASSPSNSYAHYISMNRVGGTIGMSFINHSSISNGFNVRCMKK